MLNVQAARNDMFVQRRSQFVFTVTYKLVSEAATSVHERRLMTVFGNPDDRRRSLRNERCAVDAEMPTELSRAADK